MSETNDAKVTAMPEEREAAMDARELAQVTGETPPADTLDAPAELVMPTEPELRSTSSPTS